MIKVENEALQVTINPIGAEIVSVKHQVNGHEFIWQGQEGHWSRHAPILFPWIGRFKESFYEYEGQKYEVSNHGFARDLEFHVQNISDHSVSLYLKPNADTLKIYPFEFSLQVNYILCENQLTVSYEVLNPSRDKILYYNIGGHPAFNVSSLSNHKDFFDEVFLEFTPQGQYLRIPISKDGLINEADAKYHHIDQMPVLHSLFRGDTLLYLINNQTTIGLRDSKKQTIIRVKPNGMDYLAIWTSYPQKSPFIAIEPWAGIPDTIETSHNLSQKKRIIELSPRQIHTHDYTLEFIIDAPEGSLNK